MAAVLRDDVLFCFVELVGAPVFFVVAACEQDDEYCHHVLQHDLETI